jgi:clan AA aspartic protease (TIGR02281 family)
MFNLSGTRVKSDSQRLTTNHISVTSCKNTKRVCCIIVILFICCFWTVSLHADGSYYIGKDEGGIYFQTDQDGGWYIDEKDLRYFKIGETGTYSIRQDRKGVYLETGKNRKFYLDINAREQLEQKITEFNKAQSSADGKETKVIIKDNQVLVPVILGYRGKEIEVLLLLDTGASIIALHKDAAAKLKIRAAQRASIMVAGGSTIEADVAKLDYVKVGPNIQSNIYTTIIEHKGKTVAHQGLLGMNFLRGFDYTIDYKRGVINWK